MNSPITTQLRDTIAQGSWDQAAALMQTISPGEAADLLIDLPYEQQQPLFRALSPQAAAALIGEIPYYHAYVLLNSRPVEQIRDIIEQLDPADRMRFLDELPEEAWQRLMDELAETHAAQPPSQMTTQVAVAPRPQVPPAAAAETILEAKQVEKSFQQPDGRMVQVIAPTDLSLQADTVIALLGASGSGKSTLLRILAGLTKPSGGEVLWHDKPLSVCRPNFAIVFQSFALFPWLTVIENVEAPLLARGVEHEERHARAMRALDSVGLKGFETAYPKELSGGMKQRVGFARALAVEPEILFMDEPFSALDVLTAENLRGELMELWLGRKIPTRSIFLVTHNIEEAVWLADRIIVLGRNPAKIRADFRPGLPHPRERNSAEFLVYVDYIYKVMTQPELRLAPPTAAERREKAAHQMLPHARPGSIAGLLEFLNDRGGSDDLYHVAEELMMEVDDLLPIVEAATILAFATLHEGDVRITEVGRKFAEADIATRKQLFREAALAHVTLIQQMASALEKKSDHTMPLEFFRDALQKYAPENEIQAQLDTALYWARFGEIFTYDSEGDRLLLHSPAEPSTLLDKA